MLPSLVAREVIEAVRSQLRAQFPSTTRGFLRDDSLDEGRAAIDDLLARPGEVFKGPYLSFGLPFLKAETPDVSPFEHVELSDPPYLHQSRAYRRLASDTPEPTLVATGTGSGKTECFLFPLLEHCAATPAPGIKALVIYPMNALAQDQARRFAEEIHTQAGLRTRVRVGLYTGDQGSRRGTTAMSADSVITDRATLQREPPDILLTNYRMLDFLLIRPKDRQLWRHNDVPGTLRYLVVDELHTFDGAQGTDLACLVRRLRDRLGCGDELACVGTSATVGDDAEALTRYASAVFAAEFGPDSVLREERLGVAEFLSAHDDPRPPEEQEGRRQDWPDRQALEDFARALPSTQAPYLDEAATLWLGEALPDPEKLGERLASLPPFRELLERSEGVVDVTRIVTAWTERWRVSPAVAAHALDALVALAATARDGGRPWMTVRVQLWLRELRRMVATVADVPELVFRADLAGDQTEDAADGHGASGAITLPVIHCNECHASGWVARLMPGKRELLRDLPPLYESFFAGRPEAVALYPASDVPATRKHRHAWVCDRCGALDAAARGPVEPACAACGRADARQVAVVLPDMNKVQQRDGAQRMRFHRDCPYCEAEDSLLILGSRAATLSSVAIGRLYGSPFNGDDKLIAFSDSVQDAAHRAGFFAARTYTQAIRTALATTIASGRHATLAELIDGFGPDWRERFAEAGGGDEDFAATFLAPDLAWLRDWEALRDTDRLPKESTLIDGWVLPRLRWEALIAFGLDARRGRTLERTGVAVVHPEAERVVRAVEHALPRVTDEIAELRGLDAATLKRLLLGLLWQLRTRGAFHDPMLDGYLHSGNPFDLTNRRLRAFLPRVGRRSRLPRFLAVSHAGKGIDAVASGEASGWYRHWFDKLAGQDDVMASASLEAFYQRLLSSAEKSGLLASHEVRGHEVWSLDAAAWRLSAAPVTLVCDTCRHRVQVAAAERDDWLGLPCLRSHCRGEHAPETRGPVEGEDEGERVARGDLVDGHVANERVSGRHAPEERVPVRLVAAEHTAVLDADTRATVERSFKRDPGRRWDVNLLSATPTMEMGVDIGALSSVLLCSVPPAQANYLQRIGRAGRKDGNAFNLTIANGVPHDLYHFAEPLEMMRGAVRPPGIFLDATAVLERQLVAFCFDRWVQSGIADDAIPSKLRPVLDAVDNGSRTAFPNDFLDFVDDQGVPILNDFLTIFPHLSRDGRAHLKASLLGAYEGGVGRPDLATRLRRLLEEKASQRKRFGREIQQLKRDIERVEKTPADESRDRGLEELGAERRALQRLLRAMNGQQTLNFLTDEGVLPNYAFPEEGVTLKSIIFRREERAESESGDGSSYKKLELEIRRPAQVALRELAPFSRFYGNSRQVEIDQVALGGGDVQRWRLCPDCNHAANVDLTDEHDRCPRCGHAGWGAAEQRMSLLRLREVYASASDRDSRIGDDRDDREPVRYHRQFLFDVVPQAIERGWRLEEETCPFGFEYLSKATVREINFGRQSDGGSEVRVAGENSARAGFPICRHCGKVRRWRPRGQSSHTRRCPAHGTDGGSDGDGDGSVDGDGAWLSLNLFRELSSEAVRLLLPIADIALSETRLHSFTAALHLGLHTHFKGNVDHLQILPVSEPVPGTALRRHYLVLFDSVPGGTGYLATLLKAPENFHAMLLGVKAVLESCPCGEDPAKDGCYRCLFAYRLSHQQDVTSRRTALETLELILSHWGSLAELERGTTLDHTAVNRLFDSELERRFIDVLGTQPTCTVDERPFGVETGYELTVRRAGGTIASGTRWSIEPQANLGEKDGVAIACRPDFVLRCLSGRGGEVRPIAVFTDGFEYHASIQADDTAKRYAVLASGGYRVWTIGWHDLPDKDKRHESMLGEWFGEARDVEMTRRLYDEAIAKTFGMPAHGTQPPITRAGPFEQLLHYLAEPVLAERVYTGWAISRAFGLVDKQASREPALTLQRVGTWLPEPWRERHVDDRELLLGSHDLGGEPSVAAVVAIPRSVLATLSAAASGRPAPSRDGERNATADAASVYPDRDAATTGKANGTDGRALPSLPIALVLLLDDERAEGEDYRKQWRRFWAAANLLQFLPEFLPASRRGIEARVYAGVIDAETSLREEREASAGRMDDALWDELASFSDHPEALERLAARGVAPPDDVGMDTEIDGVVVARAEWYWQDARALFVPASEDKAPDQLRAAGWRVIETTDDAALDTLQGWLEEH